jgi:hypothetical protein
MDPDLVAPGYDLVGKAVGLSDPAAEHEKRGSPTEGIQGIEDLRSRFRVRAIIEGKGHVINPPDSREPG